MGRMAARTVRPRHIRAACRAGRARCSSTATRGPRWRCDRLQRVIAGGKEWSGATPQQIDDAYEALDWLNDTPAFKEIRYDVDRVTGAVTNCRERSWDYEQGQRPRALPWRDAQGNEVTQAGKPKQPQARAPPK